MSFTVITLLVALTLSGYITLKHAGTDGVLPLWQYVALILIAALGIVLEYTQQSTVEQQTCPTTEVSL